MKVNILDIKGKPSGQIELPEVFSHPVRSDIVKRSFLAIESSLRQAYGSDPMAGKRTSAHYHGRRRVKFSMIMTNHARIPRLHGGAPHLSYRARRVPQSVKGRRAHPPKAMKNWVQKINNKENMLALKSVFAATASQEYIQKRGHLANGLTFPLIIKDDLQSLKKTKDVLELLINLGLDKELERIKEKKVRAGKGKRRGRKYKRKVGPILIIGEDKGLAKAGKNISGVDVRVINDLTVKDLAPGAEPGRLAIYSQSAIKKIEGFVNGSV